MTDSPAVRRILTVAVAVFAVAAVLAAAIVGGDDGGEVADVAATDSSTSTSPDGPTSTSTSATAGEGSSSPVTSAPAGDRPTTTTAAAAATTTSTARSTATSAPPQGSAPPVAVPAAGTYRYRVTSGTEQRDGSTKVEDKGPAQGGGRNLALTLTGQGFDSVSDVLWGPQDVRVLRSRIFVGTQSFDCDWEPDHLELELDLAKGSDWSSTSSCTVGSRKVDRTSTAKVVELRRERVAGADVDVWVIEGTERFAFGGQTEDSTSTSWFSPAHGLIVRSDSRSSRGTTTLEIQNLRPE